MTTRQIYNRLIEIKFNLIESPNIPKLEMNKLNSLIREIDDLATKEAFLRRQQMMKVIHEADIA